MYLLDLLFESVEYEWLDVNRAVFTINDTLYGVHLEDRELHLSSKKLLLVNVVFGVVNGSFNTAEDLDLTLTNNHVARTVFGTIGKALSMSSLMKQVEVIVFGATDARKDRDRNFYSLLLSRLKNSQFPGAQQYELISANGSKLAVLSTVVLSADETEYITDTLGLSK